MSRTFCLAMPTPPADGQQWPKPLPTRVKLVTFRGLVPLICIFRGATAQAVSNKDKSGASCPQRASWVSRDSHNKRRVLLDWCWLHSATRASFLPYLCNRPWGPTGLCERSQGLGQSKNPMTSSGFKPATSQLVECRLNRYPSFRPSVLVLPHTLSNLLASL
jgi:hypothetical protein